MYLKRIYFIGPMYFGFILYRISVSVYTGARIHFVSVIHEVVDDRNKKKKFRK